MTFTQLKYIIALDSYRNFSKAADKCNVSQPSLSTQVQKLEDELGTMIFDRSKSPIVPTSVGEQIISQAVLAMHEMDTITDIVNMNACVVSGQLRVGIIPSLAPYLLPLFLQKFIIDYPKVTLIFSEAPRKELFEKLQREELDIAIAPTISGSHGFNEKNLFYEPFVGYVSKNHRLFNKKKLALGDLSSSDILLLNQDHCMVQQTENLIVQLRHSADKRETPVLFESGNIETLKSLVESDYSMTLLPYLAVHHKHSENEFTYLREFSMPEPKREISIFFVRSFQKLNLINALYECIRESVPKKLLAKNNCIITCLEDLKVSLREGA